MPPKIEVVQLNDLKTGDQIAVMGNVADLHSSLRPYTDGTYFHHGIFDREKLEVIDFHGVTKSDAKPKRRPILDFAAGRAQLYRVIHEECLTVEETMQEANKIASGGEPWPVYDLITNNCETFATYLKTGNRYSAQVSAALSNLFSEVAVGMSVAGVGSTSVGSFCGRR